MSGRFVRLGVAGRATRTALVALVFAGSMATATSALDRACDKSETLFEVSERLEEEAETLVGKAAWLHAAELMLRAAELRPECSIERIEALREAATYFRFAGEYDRAGSASFEAAETGVWSGQVTVAADAFIDAATYALEAGDDDMAFTAARHAVRLSGSPLLSQTQSLSIRGRADRLLERGGPIGTGRPGAEKPGFSRPPV